MDLYACWLESAIMPRRRIYWRVRARMLFDRVGVKGWDYRWREVIVGSDYKVKIYMRLGDFLL